MKVANYSEGAGVPVRHDKVETGEQVVLRLNSDTAQRGDGRGAGEGYYTAIQREG